MQLSRTPTAKSGKERVSMRRREIRNSTNGLPESPS
jgi:hypothetical protein